MVELSRQLQYFFQLKVNTDPLWRDLTVIYSGHEVPGEGEHKIMDYIRSARSQPGYDPNTSHCLYGLDADLIVLSLLSHEPRFTLLRETVSFGPRKQVKGKRSQEYQFFHLSVLRDYMDLEFSSMKSSLPFDYALERVIDDFIFLGLLVGNDFIPCLPPFYIPNGGLTILFNVYRQTLPSLGGYLLENATMNLERCQKFFAALVSHERVRSLLLSPSSPPPPALTLGLLTLIVGLFPGREGQSQVDETEEG